MRGNGIKRLGQDFLIKSMQAYTEIRASLDIYQRYKTLENIVLLECIINIAMDVMFI